MNITPNNNSLAFTGYETIKRKTSAVEDIIYLKDSAKLLTNSKDEFKRSETFSETGDFVDVIIKRTSGDKYLITRDEDSLIVRHSGNNPDNETVRTVSTYDASAKIAERKIAEGIKDFWNAILKLKVDNIKP
ncbi:MAG: hypothetical protein AB1782_04910 [Cyanobacteriota bacterium]